MEPGQKHPIGMYTLSITALFQNFGFWGVVSFFPLYLTGEHQYSESDATEAYGVFLGIATALPLLGGYASSYLKRYSISILLASLCLVLGCILLSLNIESLLPFSLAFVALGYGLFWHLSWPFKGGFMIVGNHCAMRDLAFFMLSPPAASY